MSEIHWFWRIFLAVVGVSIFFGGRATRFKTKGSGSLSTLSFFLVYNVFITLIAAAIAVLAAVGRAPW